MFRAQAAARPHAVDFFPEAKNSPPPEKEMLPFGAETEHNIRQEVAHEC